MLYAAGTTRLGTKAGARCGRSGSQGFVLATVLWLLAGLTVAAALASQYVLDAAQNAQLLRTKAQTEQDFLSSRSRALYVLASTMPSPQGLVGADRALRLDDRPYQGEGKTQVQVQDARGLVNLNRLSMENGLRLLQACGVDAKLATGLLDKLADYTDEDDLTRLEGAESSAYKDAGKLLPRNAPLAETQELWQVLGWAAVRAEWRSNGCDRAVSVLSEGGFNLRTAPLPAMLANGISLAYAQELVAQRLRPEAEDSLAQSFADNDESANPFARISILMPGQIYRVTHTGVPGAGQEQYSLEYWVILRSGRPQGPWYIASPARALAKAKISAADKPSDNSPAVSWPLFPRFSNLPGNQSVPNELFPNLPFSR